MDWKKKYLKDQQPLSEEQGLYVSSWYTTTQMRNFKNTKINADVWFVFLQKKDETQKAWLAG